MSACDSVGSGEPGQADANAALTLLERALDIIDRLNLPPEVPARIQQAIDTLNAAI